MACLIRLTILPNKAIRPSNLITPLHSLPHKSRINRSTVNELNDRSGVEHSIAMLLNPFLTCSNPRQGLNHQPAIPAWCGWFFHQTICNHLIGGQMLQSDLSIAYMILNSMIPNHYVLHFQVVDRVVLWVRTRTLRWILSRKPRAPKAVKPIHKSWLYGQVYFKFPFPLQLEIFNYTITY